MLLKNIIWDYSGRFSLLFANLVVTAVLSRILTPADYGTVGIVMAISGLASIFLEFGFTSAIIQKKEVQEVQLSTIFYIAFAASLIIYIFFFLLAPLFARFYESPILSPLIRVSALVFIVNAWNLVPNALITKRMMFKEQSIRNVSLIGLIGGVAIFLAYQGWGVWALVLQSLLNATILVFINQWLTKWRPKWLFELDSIREMFHYSKYLFLSSALNTVFLRLDALLIGKALNINTLGLYSRAKGMENMIQGMTTSSLNAVMFPYFSSLQEDETQLKNLFHRFFHFISTIIFLFTGLAYLNARWIFEILFGIQWTISADYYRIIALSAFVYPLSALMLSIVSARGNSKDFFKAELWKKLIFLPAFAFVFWSIEAFLYATVVSYIAAIGVNLYFLKRSIQIKQMIYWKILGSYCFITAIFLIAYHILKENNSFFDKDTILPALILSLGFIGYFILSMRFFLPIPFKNLIEQAINLKKRIYLKIQGY